MRSGYRLLAASAIVGAIFPCAIDTTPSFVPLRTPEKFDSVFVRGDLGILVPTLSEKYKLIAWRYLSGLPLDTQEQEAILAPPADDEGRAATEEWEKARQSTGAGGAMFFNFGKGSRIDPGSYYANCLPDAFTTAARTLSDRQQRYADKALVAAWVAAQDEVFKNCMANQPFYPAEPDAMLPALARADRLYQIAAAHFYAEDLEGAEQRFRTISADENSPWRETAAYLIARTLIRESSLLHKPDALAEAKAQLQKIGSGPLHDSAQGMIGFIGSLEDPGTALKSIAAQLASPHSGSAFASTLATGAYVLTSKRFSRAIADPGAPEPFKWIHALESRDAAESIQGWQQSHNTLWLVAALIRVNGHDADLIDAGLKVPSGSPAFDTAMYNTIRLMTEGGQGAEARRRLDDLLSGKRRTLDSVDNVFRGERMSLATGYDDFLRWAPRRVIDSSDDSPPILGFDSVDVFNYFAPLPKLLAAAESARLPEWPRTQIAISAWTRAYMLGDGEIANRLTAVLRKIRPAWVPDLTAFQTMAGDEKRFAGALMILRHSDFNPHVESGFSPQPATDGGFGPDWWCAEPLNQAAAAPPDVVISAAEQKEASREVNAVHDAGSAQAFLAPIVMAWSKTHANDVRVPEALYRLVRVTRYGCRNVAGNGEISKAAFDLLHSRYSDNEWTRQTPYWFK